MRFENRMSGFFYTPSMRPSLLIASFLLLAMSAPVHSPAQDAPAFLPLEQWKTAVIARDVPTLEALYAPGIQISTVSGKVGAASDVVFWTGLNAKSFQLTITQQGAPQPGIWAIAFQAKITTASPGHVIPMVVEQYWQQQGGIWRLVALKRDVTKLAQPLSLDAKIYPPGDAHASIAAAQSRAAKLHKHILIVFGADWCYDCHVLEKAFHRPDITAVLTSNYEVVNVDIGQGDKNLDLMNQYEVPIKRGVPAIAVLDSSGKLLFSQKDGEFERARALGPEDLLMFLKKWKP
jgi:thioredoxin 1